MKKIISIVLVLVMVFSLAACGDKAEDVTVKSEEKEGSTEVKVVKKTEDINEDLSQKWAGHTLLVESFTDELQHASTAFEEMYGGKVEYIVTSLSDYQESVIPKLETGIGASDVIACELSTIMQFSNNGFYENLSTDPYNAQELEGEIVEYVYDLGKDLDGNVRALSWQMTPGGLYYRRSIAKEVFGTEDPDEIGKLLGTVDGFFEAAYKLKENGYRILASETEFSRFTNPEQDPWVDGDNNLVLGQGKKDMFDYAKELRDQELTAMAGEWSGPWFAGMYGPIQIEEEETSVFAYALPTWGLNFVIKPASPEGEDVNPTAGDWAITNGPGAYFSGGTWIGMFSGSKEKEMAWDFIEMVTTESEYLKGWIAETGEVTSVKNLQVIEGVEEPFLGGQNHQEYFIEASKSIDGSKITKYDQFIESIYGNSMTDYISGLLTKEEAIQKFRDSVKSAYPEINVE